MGAREPVPWQAIEEATRRVLDRPAAERGRALDEACGDDTALRREVEAMLDAVAASDGFMSTPALSGVGALSPERARDASASEARAATTPPPLPAGAPEIPGYRLLEPIGSGGMGDVYLAARSDGRFDQQVAVKVLRDPTTDESLLARFRQETKILARLTHRHVANLIDAGVASDGRPYLLMEHVDGRPITEYCDECTLRIEDRLQLFMQVCRGAGHAHRNGVVHRDLKPSNILVSTDAEAKLLDFGIAKVLGGEDGGSELALTRTSQLVLTPLHAAPEQIRGGALSTATDVFVLGIVLYELLTGRHPFVTDAWSVGETERRILDVEPEAPSEVVTRVQDLTGPDGRRIRVHPEMVSASRGVTPGRLRTLLRGDLDAIVRKALAKRPDDRYADADALGRDLERHVMGQPVVARPHARGARAVTWLRRRLAGGTASRADATSAREAGRQARRADAMMGFLARMFELAAPSSAGNPRMTVREMLDWAAAHADEELAGEDDALADILATLGRILHEIGDDQAAIPVLERSLRVLRRRYASDDPRVLPALRWLGTAYQDQAEHDKAERYFRAALAATRAAYGERHLEVSSRLNDLALVLDRRGDLAESKALYEESLAIKREHLSDEDPQVLTIVNNLAVVLQRMGHARQAEHLLRQVLVARRRIYGDESVYVAMALSNLMIAHRRRGDHAGAEPLAREALALRERLLGADHPDTALSLFNLGCVVRDLGREEEAEPLLGDAIERAISARGEDHPIVAGMVSAMATLRRRQGRYAEAEELARRALARMEAKLGERHPKVANVQLELGLVLLASGRPEEAVEWLDRVVSTRAERLGEDSPLTTEAREALERARSAGGATRPAGETNVAPDRGGRRPGNREGSAPFPESTGRPPEEEPARGRSPRTGGLS